MSKILDKDENINIEFLQEVVTSYNVSTEIPVYAIDEQGNCVYNDETPRDFCSYFKKVTGRNCPCKQAHLYASNQAALIGEAYIFFCPAGLVNFTVPLIYKKEFKGALVAGPILMNNPDDVILDEIVKKNDLESSLKDKLMSYLKAVPVIEPKRVRYLSKLLFMVAENVMWESKMVLQERNQRMNQQSEINDSIQMLKEEHVSTYYPFEKEKSLISYVKNGDIIGAKTILNELLGHVFFSSGGKIEIIKARTLELCTLLSRAAVEGGAALDKIFGMNYRFIGELSKIDNIEDLSYWTLKVLHRFTESVYNLEGSKNNEIIRKTLNFINENYKEHINLDSVSKYIHLNSSYLSTIFKKEVGIGFSDYLNKVRIEKSKQMLKKTEYSILDIALAVGFEDQGYYCKIFKKLTGMTPKQFRKL